MRTWLFVAAVIFLTGFGLGWGLNGTRLNADIDRLKLAQQTAIADAAQASEIRLTLAAHRNAEIAEKLSAAENRLITTEREKNDALKKLTTGRACLAAPAVRLLNGQPAGLQFKATSLPAPQPQPLPEDARFATDTDVGQWIAGCQRYYDTCRERIDALREFYDDERRGASGSAPEHADTVGNAAGRFANRPYALREGEK